MEEMRPIAIEAPGVDSLPSPVSEVTFGGALRSELTKIRSVRSTRWTLLAMIGLTVAFGAIATYAQTKVHRAPYFDPTSWSVGGVWLSELVIGVVGTLVITSEYSTGMIRTSLTALPQRGLLLAAKAVVLAAVAFVLGLIASLVAFFVGQAIMSSHHISTTITHLGVLRAVIGGALYLTVGALLAFGIGLLIRHTAGAVSAVVAVLFLLPIAGNLLPHSLQDHVNKWLPTAAGAQIYTVNHAPHLTSASPIGANGPMFPPWTGFAVFCGYAAIALAAGLILFRKRDA
jgi:ABC-type transport system involved in multi-copper enzyme maturation permease subunit